MSASLLTDVREQWLSEEFCVNVGMHMGSVRSLFLFALAVNVITVFATEDALSELLHADDIVLMSETIEDLRNKFINGRRLLRANI